MNSPFRLTDENGEEMPFPSIREGGSDRLEVVLYLDKIPTLDEARRIDDDTVTACVEAQEQYDGDERNDGTQDVTAAMIRRYSLDGREAEHFDALGMDTTFEDGNTPFLFVLYSGHHGVCFYKFTEIPSDIISAFEQQGKRVIRIPMPESTVIGAYRELQQSVIRDATGRSETPDLLSAMRADDATYALINTN